MIYRRLIGIIMAFCILPMPFLYVILPPFWMIAGLVAAILVWRPHWLRGIPGFIQNILAVASLIVVLNLGGWHVGPIRPMGHFLLLLASISATTVVDRKSFMRALRGVFLLWVISVASSTHIALGLYLAVSTVFWWWIGMRLLLLGLGSDVRPRIRHVVAASLAVVMLAVPIFISLPRLRSPWIAGSAINQRQSGFSTSVKLDRSGPIEESQQLALTLSSTNGKAIQEHWTRLRATSFTMVFAGSWESRQTDLSASIPSDTTLRFDRNGPALKDLTRLEIEIANPRRYLFLPEGTAALEIDQPVRRDNFGGVLLDRNVDEALRYTVWAGSQPVPRTRPPRAEDTYLPRFNPEVQALAKSIVADDASAEDKAQAIETYLRRNFEYTLDIPDVDRSDPIAWFLLNGRQGHCEFFAGSMVVLLRHLDVPARLVAGYNGGSLAKSGEIVYVREANAHAWVEAWLGNRTGWVRFDPTPAVGVPALQGQTLLEQLAQTWQRIQDSWDRYVLTFGIGDQVALLGLIGEFIAALPTVDVRTVSILVVASLGIIVVIFGIRRRSQSGRPQRRPAAARAMHRLARRLNRSGSRVPPRATLRWIANRAVDCWPQTEPAVIELMQLAEIELYAGGGDSDERRIRELWRSIQRTR